MNKNVSQEEPVVIVNKHEFLNKCLIITDAAIKGLEQWQATLEAWLEADEVEEVEFEVAFIRMCCCGGVELTNDWWQDLYRAIIGYGVNPEWLHNVALLFLPKWVDKDVRNEINHSINEELLSK